MASNAGTVTLLPFLPFPPSVMKYDDYMLE
jgi:hypothetical protein